MKRKLKVAVTFNEAHPDYYKKQNRENPKRLDFIPYFEVDNLSPIEEYEILARKLTNFGFNGGDLLFYHFYYLVFVNPFENPFAFFRFFQNHFCKKVYS